MNGIRRRAVRLATCAVLGIAAPAALAPAQAATQVHDRIDGRPEVQVNSELERYLRFLQSTGHVAPYPWSIRSFSLPELEQVAPRGQHPWAHRYSFGRGQAGPLDWGSIRPRAQVLYNSAFPYGANNGAIWAGRGITSAVEFGVAARLGPLSLSVAPVAFHAANDPFELMPNGQAGRLAFANARRFSDDGTPLHIDLPQRFGDEAYTRVDPGQSTVRLDLAGIALGFSTANQHWGPAGEYPILLGNNAPGYQHGFVGTSAPVNLWIGRLHARLVWGRLEQTEYAPPGGRHPSRLMTGHVATFTPRGLPGLEVGLGRFFHEAWPEGGLTLSRLGKPFEAFFKTRLADGDPEGDGSDPDNQLASVFARWVFPGSGLEVYGEYGRNDHSWDTRDFILEPDQNAGYLLGIRKVWLLSGERMATVRGEVLNTAISHVHQVRTPQVPFYRHHVMRQGHTHRGQILGAANGYGGGGSEIATDYYHPGGRLSLAWTRELRQERGNYWWDRSPERLAPDELDVIHALGADALVFRGRWEVGAGLAAVYNLNRDYRADVFNLNARLELRAGF